MASDTRVSTAQNWDQFWNPTLISVCDCLYLYLPDTTNDSNRLRLLHHSANSARPTGNFLPGTSPKNRGKNHVLPRYISGACLIFGVKVEQSVWYTMVWYTRV